MHDARTYLEGDEFDGVMNYLWLFPTAALFAPWEKSMPIHVFREQLAELTKAYGEQAVVHCQNLLESHDTGRFVSMMENTDAIRSKADDYFDSARLKNNRKFKTTQPDDPAYSALMQALVFMMTYPGSPMIYQGIEQGVWGANDPDNRQPMWWPDIQFDDLASREPRTDVFKLCKELIGLRKSEQALSRGSFKWLNNIEESLLGYERSFNDEVVTVLLNISDQPVDAPVDGRLLHGEKTERIGLRKWKILKRA